MEPITAKGIDGTVIFDGATITIDYTHGLAGRRSIITRGSKQIPVGSIQAVKWKPASFWSGSGLIEFTIAGAVESGDRSRHKAKLDRNENAVVVSGWSRRQTANMAAIKDAVLQVIADR